MTTTDSPSRPRNRVRSLGAVFAGFVAVVVLSVSTDAILHATGVFPPWGLPMSNALFLLATAYRTVDGVVGSYVTARLAPHRPMAHSMAGAVLGLAVATAGAVATWNAGPEFGPHWYPLALIATVLPCAWAGASLYLWQIRAR